MKGARILVVDDESQILRALRPAFGAEGYELIEARNGSEAVERMLDARPNLVVLDLGLPDLDGKDVLRRIRVFADVPVIVLSARDRESEKVLALDLGASDYVAKPFGIGELLARVRAALRRRPEASAERIAAGDLTIDVIGRRVEKAGAPVALTPKEFDLLVLLARHAGRPVAHRTLLSTLWGPAHADDVQYLRVLVGQLRAKIEEDGAEPKLILTEPGIGYRMAPQGGP
jgi:two-component system, OmpR family, KDP operon response regulator KdpE